MNGLRPDTFGWSDVDDGSDADDGSDTDDVGMTNPRPRSYHVLSLPCPQMPGSHETPCRRQPLPNDKCAQHLLSGVSGDLATGYCDPNDVGDISRETQLLVPPELPMTSSRLTKEGCEVGPRRQQAVAENRFAFQAGLPPGTT